MQDRTPRLLSSRMRKTGPSCLQNPKRFMFPPFHLLQVHHGPDKGGDECHNQAGQNHTRQHDTDKVTIADVSSRTQSRPGQLMQEELVKPVQEAVQDSLIPRFSEVAISAMGTLRTLPPRQASARGWRRRPPNRRTWMNRHCCRSHGGRAPASRPAAGCRGSRHNADGHAARDKEQDGNCTFLRSLASSG